MSWPACPCYVALCTLVIVLGWWCKYARRGGDVCNYNRMFCLHVDFRWRCRMPLPCKNCTFDGNTARKCVQCQAIGAQRVTRVRAFVCNGGSSFCGEKGWN